MAIDLQSLWNYSNPAESEERFRSHMEGASLEDQQILQTQIARSWGIRRDFEKAREILGAIDPKPTFGEPLVRFLLESGRSWCSTTHAPELLTPQAREEARRLFTRAFEEARNAQLDGLAVDALHMMVTVDTDPEDQLSWNRKALALVEASNQDAAKKWEGSLRNNLGYALNLAGRHDEALEQFEQCLELRRANGSPSGIRIAKWMIAWAHRTKGDLDLAYRLQIELDQECLAASEPDPYVYEELEAICRAKGRDEEANGWKAKMDEATAGS